MREGELREEFSLQASLGIPNSSPSQARLNPNGSNLRLMRTETRKASPSHIGIGPSCV
jgi:hypothetical protein